MQKVHHPHVVRIRVGGLEAAAAHLKTRIVSRNLIRPPAPHVEGGIGNHVVGLQAFMLIVQQGVPQLQVALQDQTYPAKPKEGQSGPGPEALRYALAVELHDMHTARHWEQAEEAMVPYFERVVSHHYNE